MIRDNLNKAGGRLKYSIEMLTNMSFFDFTKIVKSVSGKTLYNWSKKDELSFKKLKPLLGELPRLSLEYIIQNDQSKYPKGGIVNNLQIKPDEKIESSQSERIIKLLEDKVKLLEEKVGTIKRQLDECLEKQKVNSGNEPFKIKKQTGISKHKLMYLKMLIHLCTLN